jgi:hypothetical protein
MWLEYHSKYDLPGGPGAVKQTITIPIAIPISVDKTETQTAVEVRCREQDAACLTETLDT